MSFEVVNGVNSFNNWNSNSKNRATFNPVTKPNKVSISFDGSVISISGAEADVIYILIIDGVSYFGVTDGMDISTALLLIKFYNSSYSMQVQGFRLGIGGEVSDVVEYSNTFTPSVPVLSSGDIGVDFVVLSWE